MVELFELAVPINHDVARVPQESVFAVGEISGHLAGPFSVWTLSDPGDLDLSGFQTHDDQDVEGDQAVPGPYFHGGEVDGGDGVPMGLQEGLPGCPMLSYRDGFDTVRSEEITYFGVGDLMAQVYYGTLDAVVAPGWVFLGQAEDELDHDVRHSWPAGRMVSVGAIVPFLRNEPSVPTEDRVGRHDCRQLHYGLAAQSLALDSQ